jgi:hypothetical protein
MKTSMGGVDNHIPAHRTTVGNAENSVLLMAVMKIVGLQKFRIFIQFELPFSVGPLFRAETPKVAL